jgi:hypothetical protein
MFLPRGEKDKADGITYLSAHHVPLMNIFRSRDLPPIDPAYTSLGYAQPVIALHPSYQDYFRHNYTASTVPERYRALLAFTITLVHEVAHAYYFWLTPGVREPLWCLREHNAELGGHGRTMSVASLLIRRGSQEIEETLLVI